MQIAISVATYANPEVTRETVSNIKTHMTDKIITMVDAKGWHLFQDVGCDLIRGMPHGLPYNSHLNQILGLRKISELYDVDWYGHIEWDVLIRSEILKKDLESLPVTTWMAGCELREWNNPWPFMSEKIGIKIESTRYILGCIQFYRKNFLSMLWKTNFIQEIIKSHGFWRDKWPDYKEYSTDEAMLPSICCALGGDVHEFKGNKYAVRYRPVWTDLPDAEIIHPVKMLTNHTI